MQLLIASYTASHLDHFKGHQCIKDLFREGGDFVLDVIERTQSGSQGKDRQEAGFGGGLGQNGSSLFGPTAGFGGFGSATNSAFGVPNR